MHLILCNGSAEEKGNELNVSYMCKFGLKEQ